MRRKLICMLMAGSIALGALSAAGCGEKSENKPFPVYKDDKEMMIGGWDAPLPTLEDYRLAKEMGLTFMFLDDLFVKRGTQAYADVLGYCEQVGLKTIITLGNAATIEYAAESWAADKTDYSKFPAVTAINYWDEPYFSNIARIAELTEEHVKKYGSEIDVFANLFPNSATGTFEGHTYNEYVGEYVDKVLAKVEEGHRYLSADIYPLDKKSTGESALRSNWLNCIETIAVQAKRVNAVPHFFLQATEHYTYRAVTEEDLRWQFYVYMAFGIKAFTYFTYRTSILEDFSNSCVDAQESGKKYPLYDYAKAVNREIHDFDHVYLNFDWNGTMPVLGTQSEQDYNLNFDGLNNPLDEVAALNGAQATQDALIGQFKDESGNDGLIVVNFTDPAYGLRNTVRLDFKNASKVRVYKKGVAYDYQVLENHFELELGVGEGVFMIPVK